MLDVRRDAKSLSAEKFTNQSHNILCPLEMRQVPGAIEQRHARVRNAPGELIGVDRRDDAVGFAPDDQGRHADAVDVLLQAFVGNGPDEFAGAGLRPDEVDLGVDPCGVVFRHREEFLS